MHLPVEVIKKKRKGLALSAEEIQFFIQGYTTGQIPDYQMSALLMAVFFRGMTVEETTCLTQAMLHSGVVVQWPHLKKFKVDKHSTGGVGDKTSLILAPIVAACGYAVPMISGRGLGHTGGTLDKLESIPGFNTQLSLEKFTEFVQNFGLSFIGQTAQICPADKKIYALRDVTGTVESLPLICASIISKKLAEGIDGLVLDVKYGSGAFMKSTAEAELLAENLKALAESNGKKVVAVLSNMNQPLGRFAGNALEVQECVSILKNQIPASSAVFYNQTRELSLILSAHMLGLANNKPYTENYQLAESKLLNGEAYKIFEQIVLAQGGQLSKLPSCKKTLTVFAKQKGFIETFDTEGIGVACIVLKAGRAKTDDRIEPTSGIEFHSQIGDLVSEDSVIYTVYSENENDLQEAQKILEHSFKINLQKINPQSLIYKVIS
ncbi:MAG: thymidine phosphorylase [Pseudobdellovibrionaceae bacterium]